MQKSYEQSHSGGDVTHNMTTKADLSNWRTTPHSQWAFVNVDEILKTTPVSKSSHPHTFEEARNAAFDKLQIPVSEDTKLSLEELLKAGSTDGLVVLQHGKLVYDYYANGNSASSKHILMSMTKSMTGLIIGALVTQGVLAEDDKVTKHLPELSDTAFAPATIRHLLDMRSGIKYADATPEYRAAVGWNPPVEGGPKDLESFMSKLKPNDTETPPAGFVYATVNTDVLGLLLERVTGKKYAELVHELLWEPAGAKYDALLTVDSSGLARAGGGLAASVEDVARIGQAVIDGTIVSNEWLNSMLHGGDTEVFAASAWGPGFKAFSQTLAYRSFWTCSGKEKLCIALGIHGQMLVVDLENEIVMAKTASQPEPFDPKAAGLGFRLFRTLQHVLKQ